MELNTSIYNKQMSKDIVHSIQSGGGTVSVVGLPISQIQHIDNVRVSTRPGNVNRPPSTL